MTATTTYSELTAAATHRLTLARTRPELSTPVEGGSDLQVAGDAHRDLSASLALLGRTLMRPLATAPPEQLRASRRRGPAARLLRELDRRGRGRDWTAPEPPVGTAARDLHEAARAIRAASDLWATHHCESGRPRSPESSRMRHPAVLGAATREWEALVTSAADIADALVEVHTGSRSLTGAAGVVEHLLGYPRPPRGRRPPGTVHVTVARPTPRRSGSTLELLGGAVTRLRQAAWSLAESRQAPIPALANLAVVGAALTRAALDEAEWAAHHGSIPHGSGRDGSGPHGSGRDGSGPHGSGRDGSIPHGSGRDGSGPHGSGRDGEIEALRQMHAGWIDASRIVAGLRSPHPATTILQVERSDVVTLLNRLLPARGPRTSPPGGRAAASGRLRRTDAGPASELGVLAARYAEVARFNERALRAAAGRGDIYIRGEALPQQAVARRPDLLQARLERCVVPAPRVVVTALSEAYLRVADALDGRAAQEDDEALDDAALDDVARNGTPAA